MIVIGIKGEFVKSGPKIVKYRDYSKFDAIDFKKDLLYMISSQVSEIEHYLSRA